MSRNIIDSVQQALSLQRGNDSVADRALQLHTDTQSVIPIVTAFDELDEKVDQWIRVGVLSTHGLALALSQIQKIWDRIPAETTSKWNYDFWEYARWRSQKSQSTVRNYITVAKTFLSGETPLNAPAEFDPWKVDQSTLLLAAHAARTGKLDEESWKVLSNPDTTYGQVQELIAKIRGKPETSKEPNKPFFFLQDNRLCFNENGVTVALGDLEDTNITVDEEEREKVPYIEHGLSILREKLGIS